MPKISLAEIKLAAFKMCYQTEALCGICGVPAGAYTQSCPPETRQAPGHQIYHTQTTIRPTATLYSCPNPICPANQDIHHALTRMQAIATQKGRAYPNYVSFNDIKQQNEDKDEACHLALTPPLLLIYPPSQVHGAKVAPDWLSQKEWRVVATKYSQGISILEIARLVRKNASSLRRYIDYYIIKPSSRVPSLSEASTDDSTTDVSTEYSLFEFDEDEEIVPLPGMPHPTFLNRSERQIVFSMYQQNKTIKLMAETVHKPRYKISQFINAYMRHRLIKLQTAQRDAENQGVQAVDPGLWHQVPTPRPVSPNATSLGTSLNEEDLETMLDEFIKSAKVLTPGTPESDSLFGSDSPITAHHEAQSSQPQEIHTEVQYKKRKNSTEAQSEPQRPSKRPRHHSL